MQTQTNYKNIISNLKASGVNNLHIIADFDRTFTYGAVNRVKTPSIISMLRDGNHLTKGYAEKAQAMYDKYAPMETDPSLSQAERSEAMEEWWNIHFNLLIESSLSITDIEDIVQNGNVRLRNGVGEFLDVINQYGIPLVIMSASGCGDAIPMYFKKLSRDTSNISYIINRFNWDKKGIATSIHGSVIHSLNKDVTSVDDYPAIFNRIKSRKNVILIGDSIGDIQMVDGFDYNTLLKIGFLNFDYETSKDEYHESFDLVLDGESGFEEITEVIREVGTKSLY